MINNPDWTQRALRDDEPGAQSFNTIPDHAFELDQARREGFALAIEMAAKVAREYWPKSDDPTDEPGSTIRNDVSLSIANAIRALTYPGGEVTK